MAWLGRLVIGALIQAAGYLVGKVLIALGVGVVTYTGVSATIGWLKTGAVNALLGLPPEMVGILSLMKVGTCISLVFSAVLIRLSLSGLTGDTMKKWVKK
jgi:hypothetical protein